MDKEPFIDFAIWLNDFVISERFTAIANEYLAIEIQLLNEPIGKKRSDLVDSRHHLLDNY